MCYVLEAFRVCIVTRSFCIPHVSILFSGDISRLESVDVSRTSAVAEIVVMTSWKAMHAIWVVRAKETSHNWNVTSASSEMPVPDASLTWGGRSHRPSLLVTVLLRLDNNLPVEWPLIVMIVVCTHCLSLKADPFIRADGIPPRAHAKPRKRKEKKREKKGKREERARRRKPVVVVHRDGKLIIKGRCETAWPSLPHRSRVCSWLFAFPLARQTCGARIKSREGSPSRAH